MNHAQQRCEGALGGLALRLAKADDAVRAVAWPPVTLMLLRLALAVPFWKSGMLKWSGFLSLNETAVTLFADEFRLHLPGGPYPFPAPAVTAFLAGSAEILLPVLLVLGLGTRFAAAGLLLMSAVVQLTVPDGWPVHLTWAAMALAIMSGGPGPLSMEHALARRRAGASSRP